MKDSQLAEAKDHQKPSYLNKLGAIRRQTLLSECPAVS